MATAAEVTALAAAEAAANPVELTPAKQTSKKRRAPASHPPYLDVGTQIFFLSNLGYLRSQCCVCFLYFLLLKFGYKRSKLFFFFFGLFAVEIFMHNSSKMRFF